LDIDAFDVDYSQVRRSAESGFAFAQAFYSPRSPGFLDGKLASHHWTELAIEQGERDGFFQWGKTVLGLDGFKPASLDDYLQAKEIFRQGWVVLKACSSI
jgi:hypothetical protein